MTEDRSFGPLRVRGPESEPRPEPTWDESTVLAHEFFGRRYHRLLLLAPSIARRARAGQFVMVSVPPGSDGAVLLPRPMAIHRRHPAEGTLELVFDIVGRGTLALAGAAVGQSLLLTGPLGRGFEIPAAAMEVLLIGRGIGVCAVMPVAEDAATGGRRTTALLSARTRASIIGLDDAAELGVDIIAVSDDDGSSAVGAVDRLLRERFAARPPSVIMVCGADRLARLATELSVEWDVPAQVSLEAHMACGLGYCHGCAAPISARADEEGPLVCLDGPVFAIGAVV
jgi:dihydroorotate dehydrogenase electron transfer subunit